MDNQIIANIKSLGIDMIHQANSGHPGIVLGAAPIIYMAGYNLTIDDLKNFRKIGSKTPGHPEVFITPGVDVSTGPLGQGFSTGVGMALAGKILKEKTAFPSNSKLIKESLVDFNVYVLCGDGDLMEGITTEAASLAGTWKLNNLIVLYDSNNISLDGPTNNTFTENIKDKMKALGWDTYFVKNGHDLKALNKAINSTNDINDINKLVDRLENNLININNIISIIDKAKNGDIIYEIFDMSKEKSNHLKEYIDYLKKDKDFYKNEIYKDIKDKFDYTNDINNIKKETLLEKKEVLDKQNLVNNKDNLEIDYENDIKNLNIK